MKLLVVHNPGDALSGNLREWLLKVSDLGDSVSLAPDATTADAILFIDSYSDPRYRFIREHPYCRDHREKCFLFSQADDPVAVLPGIYVSLERGSHDPRWTDSFCYIDGYRRNPFLTAALRAAPKRTLLFSFMGRNSHPVRARLFAARFDRPDVVVEDTSRFRLWGERADDSQEMEKRYAEIAAASKFMLCPRGAGVSSMRLFEAMELGCVPVILGDAWTPPTGPDWGSFSIRVAEGDAGRVAGILSAREREAEAMGRRAREEWERWFKEEDYLRRIVERIGRLDARDPWLRRRRAIAAELRFVRRRLLEIQVRTLSALRK